MEGSGGGQGPFGPGSPGYGPGGPDEDDKEAAPGGERPEAPSRQPSEEPPPPPLWSAPKHAEAPPPGPQAPPPGPQAPPPGPQAPPPGPQAPPPGPQAPSGAPQAPPAPPGYGGPVPPGGWQQPQPSYSPPGELASWWSRVGATLLDSVVLFAIFLVLALVVVVGFAIHEAVGIILLIVAILAAIAVYVGYGGYFMAREGAHNGQTLGKQMVGIRVVRDSGQPYELGQGIVREFLVKIILFGWIGGTFFLPPVLDVLWPLWDDTDRALHDMIVSSHVVRA